mmetsp:Transcript_26205/g.34859  ORF Transcript_26205/g.34859 Transcript_26205/m.34859 type:complete len:101 (+) Transcript_26205:4615-4917(+)
MSGVLNDTDAGDAFPGGGPPARRFGVTVFGDRGETVKVTELDRDVLSRPVLLSGTGCLPPTLLPCMGPDEAVRKKCNALVYKLQKSPENIFQGRKSARQE